jgi:hypothetical protein
VEDRLGGLVIGVEHLIIDATLGSPIDVITSVGIRGRIPSQGNAIHASVSKAGKGKRKD